MRVVFIGRNNPFNRGMIRWLSNKHEVVAALFTEVTLSTREGKIKRIKNRVKRYGPFKVADELAFHLFDRKILRRGELERLRRDLPDIFTSWDYPVEVPHFEVKNVHSKKWLAFIEEQKPDLIFSTCGAIIFKPSLYKLPKYGTFVLHEGLTPEYKGLHTPLWALLKGETEYIGYTLLRVDDEIDGGEVLAQGSYTPAEDEGLSSWSFTGHKALIDNLPEIEEALLELEANGSFEPVDTSGRKNGYYTWMGLSEFFINYVKHMNRRARSRVHPSGSAASRPSET